MCGVVEATSKYQYIQMWSRSVQQQILIKAFGEISDWIFAYRSQRIYEYINKDIFTIYKILLEV